MLIRHVRAAPIGARARARSPGGATAHEIVGNRFFPATLGIDDPGVNDELSLPTVANFKTGDDPSFRQRDFPASFPSASPRISRSRSARPIVLSLRPVVRPAFGAHGFQNLETTFKYRLFKNPEHEFVMSVGLSVEWGGTGSANVGAEQFNTYTPTLYFGKGFGDLPDSLSWLRPFAVTGQIGYAIPGRRSTTTFGIDPDSGDLTADTEFHPRVLNWGGTMQYSMPYLKSAVVDLGLPDFINRFIPLVEATLQTPVAQHLDVGHDDDGHDQSGRSSGSANGFQIGVEALIPINRQSGTNVGVIGQLHFYLDDHRPPRHRQADLRQPPSNPQAPLRR